VAGDRGPSRAAVHNLLKICDKELLGRYEIEVVDAYKNPRAVIENNLIELPAVIRTLAAPTRRFVGNWMNENHQLVGFGLVSKDKLKATKQPRSSRKKRSPAVPQSSQGLPYSNATEDCSASETGAALEMLPSICTYEMRMDWLRSDGRWWIVVKELAMSVPVEQFIYKMLWPPKRGRRQMADA
jgi:hypothetical protein